MTRRRFFQAFAAVMIAVCLLVVSGILSAQGNSDNAFERVKEVQERHTATLMAKKGVVGTAVGLGDDGNPVVLVLLEHGAVAGVPAQLDGVKIDKMVTGEIRALADTARYSRPVPIGVSTGHFKITAGTIGCRVRDAGGNVYALSNNHVYANENQASFGENVLQPGPYDGGLNPSDMIGTLYAFEPINFSGTNTIDAAIALTTASQVGTATPGDGYGTPGSTPVAPALRMGVQKRGRTTGLTTGTIKGVNATVNVGYDGGVAQFVNQIIISPAGFSAGGDSGSLIVTQADNSPVGLLFAGSPSITIANPIGAVLAQLGVTIDTGSGGSGESPVANFSANPTSGAAPLTVQFTDSSTGAPTSWSWNFGDDGSSALQSPSHTYSTPGTYTVSLTAANSYGSDVETKINYITVAAPGAGVTVASILPDTLNAGTSTGATITGTGFVAGAKVTFENGAGPAPSASNIVVTTATTITATVKVKGGGPSGDRYWDVRVTNPDGSTGVLARGLTVTR